MPKFTEEGERSEPKIEPVPEPTPTEKQPSPLARAYANLLQLGIGDVLVRSGTAVLTLVGVGVIIWLGRERFRPASLEAAATPAVTIAPISPGAHMASLDTPNYSTGGILRMAQPLTVIPSRPRTEITEYTVQVGDTVSDIADRYGITPKTVFSANYALLQDDPEALRPGQVLKILPVSGVYWEWLGGISFGQWADYFKVKPETILSFPANGLNAADYPDPANANVKQGVYLIIPGGDYQYHTPGQVPLGIGRNGPAVAEVGGAGYCGKVTGAVGTGAFIFPTDKHTLSGYNYSEDTNHRGLDFSAAMGANIYAADGGVIVYAGWNDYGYGNMVMIDHGTGFQTLYGHLSQIFVQCGQSVGQGAVIGAAGSTGHSSGAHLHFEVRTATTVINPWDVLPAP